MNEIALFKFLRFSLYLHTVFLLTACVCNPIIESYQLVDQKVAKRFALFAMMSANSYHDEVMFPIHEIGWTIQPKNEASDSFLNLGINFIFKTLNKVSGLEYDILENKNSKNVVFAFRGTEIFDPGDWVSDLSPTSLQHEVAYSQFKKYKESHPDKNIILTGHSLGGGIAIALSLAFCVDAVSFDPSPESLRGLDGNNWKRAPNCKANRFVVFRNGEFLETGRIAYGTYAHEKIRLENIFKFKEDLKDCHWYIFNNVCKHMINPMALELLKMGKSSNDKELVKVYNAMPIYN